MTRKSFASMLTVAGLMAAGVAAAQTGQPNAQATGQGAASAARSGGRKGRDEEKSDTPAGSRKPRGGTGKERRA